MSEFENKREKNIKYGISLNTEQAEGKRLILENKISYISSKSGSGKTLLACQVALDLLFKKQVEKIIITRSVVTAGEDIGFLPGDLKEKLDPFLQAIYQNFYLLYNKEKINKLINEGVIEIIPIAFTRGRTYTKSLIIVDEAQNLKTMQTKMVLERVGKDSKMILCGDKDQIDLPKNVESGLVFLDYINRVGIQNFVKIELKTNHRDPIVEDILNLYESFKNK
jgi:phosphate starvation-inducible PhoH-like protein